MSTKEDAAAAAPVALATQTQEAGLSDPLATRNGHIGASRARVDGPLKVKGEARYAAEVRIDGMLYAALAFSTVAKGRITALDTSAAEREPGVALVMTHRNAPPMNPAPAFAAHPKGASGDNLAFMQDDRIHWNGQPIAVVLADSQEQADHAVSLIQATYDAEPARTSFAEAKATERHLANYFGTDLEVAINDAEAALAAAPVKVDATYTSPFQNQNAMEPHAATLTWDDDELLVYDCTQLVSHARSSLAEVFGIDEDEVRVIAKFIGGGFGGKSLWGHQILGAAASKLAGRPVRIVLSREGVYRVVGGRSCTEQRVGIGAQRDGRFDALIHTGVMAMTEHNAVPEAFITSSMNMYSAGSFHLRADATYMDMVANFFMRAPGEAVGSFALESAIDELADQLGMDPLELRIRNEPQQSPVTGLPFSSRHALEAYRAGAERFGWNARSATPRARREGEWLIGMGVAAAGYPYTRFPGGAARLRLSRAGHATVEVAAHEMGMGTATVHAQVAAERLGLPVEHVTVVIGDSSLPGMVMAAGSQQTASIGAAVIAAYRELVTEMLTIVADDSPLFGLGPDEVGANDGGLCKLDDISRFESYTDILSRAGREEISAEADGSPPSEASQWSMHSYGAIFCEARVNAVTAETRISRLVGSFDCGRILNPKTAASQFRGGMVMGLGLALMEETLMDGRSGRIMNASLAEYHVPVHADVPEIDVIWTDIPDPHAPMGAHGVGEISTTGVGAAVANAVFNATGNRVRDLPITLDKLL